MTLLGGPSLHVEFLNDAPIMLFAYSDSSKMNKTMQAFYEIPPSTSYMDRFGLSAMQAAHTEPKLLNCVLNNYSQGVKCFSHVTLATARDPCSSCQKVIHAFNQMHPGRITVHGFNAQDGGGVPDLSGTPFG